MRQLAPSDMPGQRRLAERDVRVHKLPMCGAYGSELGHEAGAVELDAREVPP